MSLTLKRRDTYPPFKATLKEEGGAKAIDLTAALKITMILKGPGTLVERKCTKTAAAEGKVEAELLQGSLENAGNYRMEFEIEWAEREPEAGVKVKSFQTVPNEEYVEITVLPDLGTA